MRNVKILLTSSLLVLLLAVSAPASTITGEIVLPSKVSVMLEIQGEAGNYSSNPAFKTGSYEFIGAGNTQIATPGNPVSMPYTPNPGIYTIDLPPKN